MAVPTGAAAGNFVYRFRYQAFDSMTSASSYKAPVEHDEAIRRIEAGSSTQFDPNVVRVFLELARRGDLDLT